MSQRAPNTQPAGREHYKFTVEEFHRLEETGILSREDRIELIEGELVIMPPIGPEHSSHTRSLREILSRLMPDDLLLCVAEPVTLSEHSEPLPDFSVVRRRADFYRGGHPGPEDVQLIVEVAQSSVEFDLGDKALQYARHAVAEYWVLDIAGACLHVFSASTSEGYRNHRIFQRGETVKCGTVPQVELRVDAMLL
jgi:Uma2 family endonuclease